MACGSNMQILRKGQQDYDIMLFCTTAIAHQTAFSNKVISRTSSEKV